ncbi:MAG: Eco57I restriction-modification methylase domain-containing protein [Candidatus Brocadiia bacterium]
MIAKSFQEGKDQIAVVCAYYKTNRDAFFAQKMKEATVRKDLIDRFLQALGWDVWNEERAAPQFCEVLYEESLDAEGHNKKPDYTFCLRSNKPHFYAEAKKCSVNINEDPAPALQLRSYGYSSKLPVSLLTNFENVAVYNCTIRPKVKDKPAMARMVIYGYERYADDWKEIWDSFSREAVRSGAFDSKFAPKSMRGSSQVDDDFLKEIETWRKNLALNLALRNPRLSADDLNRAVQVVIDRIIFLRMAEDRGMERYGELLRLSQADRIYRRFMKELCEPADAKYNSGLFHFHEERAIDERPDTLTPHLQVDDEVLRPILGNLYGENGSPYKFNLMPVEILGSIYERFLGKKIRLTTGHQAKVEEKPEVRKAGGVYYTPAYIVDYIVKNTVGSQIDGQSPSALAGKGRGQKQYRVLDMACGSGSFLLGAYQVLLDHAMKWYVEDSPEKHKEAVFRDAKSGQLRLTIAEKKRILTTHIFGVDIDAQAVEVTKLSLLLKVLEGESAETVGRTMQLFHERALPNLSDNIKCGNSLIGPGYFAGKLIPDADEMRRVNAFDWKKEFPDAIHEGGFDAVIGNPPYVRIQTMKEWAPLEVEIYKELYGSARGGNYDIYVVFIEAGIKRLSATGRLGFIVPHKFFNAKYGVALRAIIAQGQQLSHVVHFGDQQVFDGATTYTCLVFLNKTGVKECRFVKVNDLAAWRELLTVGDADDGRMEAARAAPSTEVVREAAASYSRQPRRSKGPTDEIFIPTRKMTSAEWNFVVGKGAALFDRLAKMPAKLCDIATGIFVGLQTSADSVFLFKNFKAGRKGTTIVASAELGESFSIETAILKRVIRSGSIGRYSARPTALVLFPYEVKNCSARLYSALEMQERFPLAWKYLTRNRDLLAAREHGKFRSAWHQLYPKNLAVWEQAKLMIPYMVTDLAAYLDRHDNFYFVNVTTGGFGITINEKTGSLEYLCGLLNSRLLDFYLKHVTTTFHGGYFAANKQFIGQLPIRQIDFNKAKDKSHHGRIVSMVNQMMQLQKRLAAAKSEAEKAVNQRQIASTDSEIDRLVYDLYGLTKAEIAILESRG